MTDPDDTPPQADLPRASRQQIRQHEILAELSMSALQGASFDQLLADTARLSAEGLRTEFSKVLEYLPAENRLLVRAGVGWEPGIVGVATIGADLGSPAGFALRTGKPVISNRLQDEQRFRTPELLQRHGVHRAMNVILQGDGRPYGVLEVDSATDERFVEHDVAFLQSAANLLGMALERRQRELNLEAALERHQFLIKEMNHRVKNSLGIVAGLLRLQARGLEDAAFKAQLEEAARRVGAVARAHDQLFQTPEVEWLDVGRYIEAICRDLDGSFAGWDIQVEAEPRIVFSTDRAISAALIVNELIANAVKHAHPGGEAGRVRVRVAGAGETEILISVRDDGDGLPSGFELGKTRGLGMRIVSALVEQIKGVLTIVEHKPGVEFVVIAPRED
jgi:two-component sensor histidine kinase